MNTRLTTPPVFSAKLLVEALVAAVQKLNPRVQVRNPVMFTVYLGSLFTTVLGCHALWTSDKSAGFVFAVSIWLWLTVLFAKSDSGFKFADDKEIAGKSLCLPEGAEEADLNRNGRGWLKQQTVTGVRAPTLEACFKMVAARDADAVMASEIEGRTVLAHSGLAGEIEMLDRPIATESLSAVVARTHPQAEVIIGRLNAALAKVKANGAYYSLVDKHLVALWGGTGAAAATP